MKFTYRAGIVFLIAACLGLSSCAPDTPPAPTSTEPPSAVLELSDLAVGWPVSQETCLASLPAPVISLCITNQGGSGPAPQQAALTVPAALVPGSLGAALSSLPGGDWLPPYPVSLTGLPGLTEGAQGIIIVNNNPAPDAAAEGIIIINNLPADANISSVLFLIDSFSDPLSAQGIIIINNKDGSQALTGAATINFDINALPGAAVVTGRPDLGFAQVAADITQDHYSILAGIGDILEFPALGQIEQLAEGIIWGGLVFDPSPDFKITGTSSLMEFGPSQDDSIPPPDDNQPPPDDNLVGIVWGGKLPLSQGSDGIIIVNTLPGPDQSGEGIVIINNKDISQVMGIIMEDKPGEDSGQAGIIIVNTKPAEFLEPGMSWGAAAWGGMPGSVQGNDAIIIVNTKPGEASHSQDLSPFDFPEGFGLPAGLAPIMDQGGFGSGPLIHLTINPQEFGLPVSLVEGATSCFEIGLPVLPLPPWDGGGTFPADSFFDVFVDLSQDGKGNDSLTDIATVTPPDLTIPICTATPIPVEIGPKLPTITPTIKTSPMPPTPTTRTGLPTATPTPPSRIEGD